jgi:hypothetical protein
MIKYDLHVLGWHAFQQLCLAICQEILGQTVSVYLDSNDAGKDGAFSGDWKQSGQEDMSGKFVIQCKFTGKQGSNLSLSDINEELDKAEKLVKNGRCDCYILMTNAGVSGAFEETLLDAFQAIGVKTAKVFGSTWISNQIHTNKKLRLMVPRVYGLGDLSQIIDERAYAQAKQLLLSMREDLSKIVITSAYHRAASALDEHGFVLIIGEAAAGKTTIASMLAMAAVDNWELSTIKVHTPQLVHKHWNPDDPSQFFWIDDAFGTTQYESNLATGWNHILPQVKTMLGQGVKIVMTSRDYIYRRARHDLKDGAFPLFNESQVVIDVQQLEPQERDQILYNHLKLGNQNKKFLTDIKPFLAKIAQHDRFIPETARRLSDPTFTKRIVLEHYSLMSYVEKQESFIIDTLKGLDIHSRAALAFIYMANGFLKSPVKPAASEISAIKRLGSNVGQCIQALESMKDSLVQFFYSEDQGGWRFKHPTIGDAYSKIVSESAEQLEIYLQGTPTDKILEQVTCGTVGLENAMVIPKNLFGNMVSKLLDFSRSDMYKTGYLSTWAAGWKTCNFLARRCSKDFLKIYLKENDKIFEKIAKPAMAFDYSAEINLVVKLHEESLLPEATRLAFVAYVGGLTISGDDLTLLKDEDLQGVFQENELLEVKSSIKEKLIPDVATIRKKKSSEFRIHNEDTAEEHMEDLFDRYNILLDEFEDDPEILTLLENEVAEAKHWVGENSGYERNKKPERKLNTSNNSKEFKTVRSIFDDIDN